MRPWPSRIAAALLVVLVLAGCTGKSGSPDPAPPAPPASQQPAPKPEPPKPEPKPAPKPEPPKPEPAKPAGLPSLIEPASQGDLVRTRFQKGEPLGRQGFYFLKVETGEVDGWLPGSESFVMHEFAASLDNRWLSGFAHPHHYLVDRSTGSLYRWPREAGRLVAAHGERLLFQGADRFWLTGADLQGWTPLPVTPAGSPQGLFTADGTAAFLVNDRDVLRVDAASGQVKKVGGLAPYPQQEHWRRLTLSHGRGGAEVLLMDAWGTWGPAPATGARLQRYGADGALLADQAPPAEARLSPDGQLISWEDGGVVVAKAATLEPLFRVRGADLCTERMGGDRWLADSSGLIIRVRGGHKIISADGLLKDSPALAGTDALNAPSPAPDRADRIAIEAVKVLDLQGNVVGQAVPHEEGKWIGIGSMAPWGLRGDEVRFYLGALGKGPRCGGFELPPLVEQPPFTAQTAYQVVLPAGDCLNLRTGPGKEAPVAACLPGGTRVTPVDSPGRVNKGWIESWGRFWTDPDGGRVWYHVKTDQGQRGWIAFSGEYLTWAPAQPGQERINPLTAVIEDEFARLAYWYGVALGEIPCTTCGWDSSFENVALGLVNRCRESDPFAHMRSAGAYEPETHDPMLARLAKSCDLVRPAYEKLGHPTQQSEAWLEVFRQARQALSQ